MEKMKINEIIENDNVDFTGIEQPYFLLGLLSAFDNRFQAQADKMMKEISWKQFFAIICIDLCKEEPTIKELAEIIGSSHQNAKQILLKLEKKGFVELVTDQNDRRKQRIKITEYCKQFCDKNANAGTQLIEKMFEGISEEQLTMTIQTIIQMESNLMKE